MSNLHNSTLLGPNTTSTISKKEKREDKAHIFFFFNKQVDEVAKSSLEMKKRFSRIEGKEKLILVKNKDLLEKKWWKYELINGKINKELRKIERKEFFKEKLEEESRTWQWM